MTKIFGELDYYIEEMPVWERRPLQIVLLAFSLLLAVLLLIYYIHQATTKQPSSVKTVSQTKRQEERLPPSPPKLRDTTRYTPPKIIKTTPLPCESFSDTPYYLLTVLDKETKQPIKGAKIRLGYTHDTGGGMSPKMWLTNRDGIAKVPQWWTYISPHQKRNLRSSFYVWADGYAEKHFLVKQLPPGQWTKITVEMEKGRTIVVKIVGLELGKKDDLEIKFYSLEGEFISSERAEKINKNSELVFTHMPLKQMLMKVEGISYHGRYLPQEVKVDETTTYLVIHLEKNPEIGTCKLLFQFEKGLGIPKLLRLIIYRVDTDKIYRKTVGSFASLSNFIYPISLKEGRYIFYLTTVDLPEFHENISLWRTSQKEVYVPGAQIVEEAIPVKSGGILHARVIEASTQKPMKVKVHVKFPGLPKKVAFALGGWTDDKGVFRRLGLPPGQLILEFWKGENLLKKVPVFLPPNKEVSLRIEL